MNRPITLAVMVTLLIAIPVMANDLIFIALPNARIEFGADPAQIQLAVSAFIMTFAVVQLVYGPLSDHFGRRPVILTTLAAYVVGAVLCGLAMDVEYLVAARILQAMGAGAAPPLARAILRDLYGAERSVRMLSYIMSYFGVIAIAAPLIGGGLTDHFGWRAVFYFSAGYGALCFFLVLFRLDESAPPGDHGTGVLIRVTRSFKILLKNRNFMLLAVSNAMVYSAMFVWLAGLAFVLIDALDMAASDAGIWFAVSVTGFALGAFLGGRLTGFLPPLQTVFIGMALCLTASVIGSLIAIAGEISVAGLIAPGFFMMMGIGLTIPPATGAGIAPFPEMAGAASSLIGFIQMAMSSASVLAVGYLYNGTAQPMMIEMAVLTGIGAVIFLPLLQHLKTRVLPRN